MNSAVQGSDRRKNIHYSVAMASFWFLNGVFTIFLVPLLKEQGFSDGQTGILLAVRAMASVGFQPFYSSLADRLVERIPLKYLIAVLIGAGIGVTSVHAFCKLSFIGAVGVFIGYGMTINCISAMLDSMSVQYAAAGSKINYTLARAIGSFAWAVASIGLGRLIEGLGWHGITLYIQLAGLILLLAVVLTMEVPQSAESEMSAKPDKDEKKKHHSIWYIFRTHPRYTLLLISVFLIFLAQNIVMSYLINKIELVGGGTGELGIAQALLALAEIFVPLYYRRLRKKVGVDRVVEIALAFTALRIVVIALSPNVTVIYLAQLTQMMACLYWSGNVEYIHFHIEEGDRIKGQGVLAAAQTGLAACAGSLIAGSMLTYLGAEGLYTFAWICALFGMTVLIGGNRLMDMKEFRKKQSLERGVES